MLTFASSRAIGRICHDRRPMPSPIGHALAGMAVAWGTDALSRQPGQQPSTRLTTSSLTLLFAGLAVAPDLDLLYMPVHRTATHSVAAAALVTIVAALVTRWVTGRVNWPIAVGCGVAWASHVLLDALAADPSRPYGIQAFWPVSDRWFRSPWVIFPHTERRSPLSSHAMWINLRAALTEMIIMGTVAGAAWAIRRRGRQGG
jgi:membrane-bound metal-dependent hydrolase YbcI (DUF457 family)